MEDSTCIYTGEECEACAQCNLDESLPQLEEIANKLKEYGFFVKYDDDKKIYQDTDIDDYILEYTCTELCEAFEGIFDKDTLELIQREDNITIIARFLPIY